MRPNGKFYAPVQAGAFLFALRAGEAASGAGEGNRTLVFSLEGCCSTIELHPPALLKSLGGRPAKTRLQQPGSRKRGGGGRGRTRTYEGIASGFTVRPLCH